MNKQKSYYIFDVDGTLTYLHGEIADRTGHTHYSFGEILTVHFAEDSQALLTELAAWNEIIHQHPDPTASSIEMMQRGIKFLKAAVSEDDIRNKATELTHHFLQCGVVRLDAIAYLNRAAESGIACILSSGSYLVAIEGFVTALHEAKLISSIAKNNISISGAIVNWPDKILLHANIRERKLLGLEKLLAQPIAEIKPQIAAVFGDDPYINDAGILELAPPGGAYVIKTHKNQHKPFNSNYKMVTWQELLQA